MTSADGRFELVFNGEIYNHEDLRPKLKDISFRGHSDSETFLNYIACFGINTVNELNGIFSFGLLDKQSKVLYLVRDRYGVKPMYYMQRGDKFVFSSEIRLIRRLFDVTVSRENLAELLKLRYCPSPDTLFNEIHKVRPGHILKYDLETHSITTFSFIQPVELNDDISFKEALREYGVLFEKAVERQLMSDVDIGVLLSGGIDSALVAHYAQKHYSKKIKSFTVGFKDLSDTNELIEARATANLVGTDHHEIVVSSANFEEIFAKCISIIEEPLGTTSVIPMYFLNEEVKKYLKVVLTGQGADEPLGGYDRYQGELLRSYVPSSAFALAGSLTGLVNSEKLSRGINSLGETDTITRFEKIYALFSDEEIEALLGSNSRKSTENITYFYNLLKSDEREPIEAMMSLDMRMNLSDDLLLYTDKVSMNFSVEARVPLLDNELSGFIESLPHQYRLRLGKGKLIHKKFAEQVLPKEIVHRSKKGFYSPTNAWFRGEIGRRLRATLTNPKSKFAAHLNVGVVDRIFQEHMDGRNREKQLFMLVSLFYWIEDFL